MKFLTELFWRFGKRLWFRWDNAVTGRLRFMTNDVNWSDLWRHRKDPMKVWVD
jgi:hypothetical protein